jgi:hypothetical protein
MTKPGQYVSHLRITCPSCGIEQPGTEFRGNRSKTAVCRTCESRHPTSRWCVDCADWLSENSFYRVGANQKFMTNRCKPCRALFTHGVDRDAMAEITGDPTPRCGACGASGARLAIDHDHNHCPGERGCRHCVRGYLCQPCNTAEGLLRTAERAQLLANYMERTRMSPDQLAELPPSSRTGKPRVRRVAGANRQYWTHPN